MVDRIVSRLDMKKELTQLVGHLMPDPSRVTPTENVPMYGNVPV